MRQAQALSPPGEGWRFAALVLVLGIAFLMVPRPYGWVGDHVHKEDGTIFLTDFLASGWPSVIDVYSGYLHVFPRLVAGINATVLPPEWWAAGVGFSMALVRGWFALLAWPLLTHWTSSWKWGLACASVFIFAPVGQQEVLGNITNLRWFGVGVTAFVLLAPLAGRLWPVAAGVTAALAVLSDPLALLLAPLAVVHFLRARGWSRSTPIIYGAGFTWQASQISVSSRRQSGGSSIVSDPIDGIAQVLVRGVDGGILGVNLTRGIMLVGGLALALVVASLILVWAGLLDAACRATSEVGGAAVLTLIGGVLFVATLYFADMRLLALTDWWTAGHSARYSLLAALFLLPAVMLLAKAGLDRKNRWVGGLAIAGLATLGIALVAEFSGYKGNYAGPNWRQKIVDGRQLCQGSTDFVTVQVTPDNVAIHWTADLSCAWLSR